MSFQPRQVRDLIIISICEKIISICEKIKNLEEEYKKTINKIREECKRGRDEKLNLNLDKEEKRAIEVVDKIHEAALKDITEILKILKTAHKEMISDLSLSPETEEYLNSLNL